MRLGSWGVERKVHSILFPFASAHGSLVLEVPIQLHVEAESQETPLGRAGFLESGELQCWRSRMENHHASEELCDKVKPSKLRPYFFTRYFELRWGKKYGHLQLENYININFLDLSYYFWSLPKIIRYHTVLSEILMRAVPVLWPSRVLEITFSTSLQVELLPCEQGHRHPAATLQGLASQSPACSETNFSKHRFLKHSN